MTNKHYERLEKTALDVGAGVVLIGHEVNNIFPFNDSITLTKINEINKEDEYTVRDISNKKSKIASKQLAAALLVSFINDIGNFYTLMNKDHKTLRNVTTVLFALVIFLLGYIII